MPTVRCSAGAPDDSDVLLRAKVIADLIGCNFLKMLLTAFCFAMTGETLCSIQESSLTFFTSVRISSAVSWSDWSIRTLLVVGLLPMLLGRNCLDEYQILMQSWVVFESLWKDPIHWKQTFQLEWLSYVLRAKRMESADSTYKLKLNWFCVRCQYTAYFVPYISYSLFAISRSFFKAILRSLICLRIDLACWFLWSLVLATQRSH